REGGGGHGREEAAPGRPHRGGPPESRRRARAGRDGASEGRVAEVARPGGCGRGRGEVASAAQRATRAEDRRTDQGDRPSAQGGKAGGGGAEAGPRKRRRTDQGRG